jgi:hypothetical protein
MFTATPCFHQACQVGGPSWSAKQTRIYKHETPTTTMYSLIAYVLLVSAAAAMAHVNKQPALPGLFLAAHHGPPIVVSVQTGLCHPWHGQALAHGKECADLGVHRVVGLTRVSTGPSPGLSVPAALDLLRNRPCPLEWDDSVAALISEHQVCCLLAEGGVCPNTFQLQLHLHFNICVSSMHAGVDDDNLNFQLKHTYNHTYNHVRKHQHRDLAAASTSWSAC